MALLWFPLAGAQGTEIRMGLQRLPQWFIEVPITLKN
jgi:hypothetical protein